jgi:hypothetical protein
MHDGPGQYNGMPASNLHEVHWRKGQRSSATGNCVQTAKLPSGGVAIRNSRQPDGPALLFGDAAIRAFLEGIKNGEFDELLG